SAGLPGGDHGAVGGFGLRSQLALGGADCCERVSRCGALAPARGGTPGTQLKLASFVCHQGRLCEGVVLPFDDQMPAQYGKFARGGHRSDLHPATGLHPLVKRHRQLVRPEGRWRSFSAWLGRVVRSCRVVQAAVVSPVTSFQVLKRLAISLRYSSAWSR